MQQAGSQTPSTCLLTCPSIWRNVMSRSIARWFQHAACVSLMALVAIVCAAGATQHVVQVHEADSSLAQALTSQTADPTIGEAHQ